jgi:hypothetical protein
MDTPSESFKMSKRCYYKLKISLSTTNLRAITALIRAITVLLPAIAGLPLDDGPLLPNGFERPQAPRAEQVLHLPQGR